PRTRNPQVQLQPLNWRAIHDHAREPLGCGQLSRPCHLTSPSPEPQMTEVTRTLSAVEHGDPHAAAPLLPLVYDERRHTAAPTLARQKPGQTLPATPLVNQAYI